LDQVGNIQDKKQALNAIDIYNGLMLTKWFDEPMRFKRVLAYLGYVATIFYVVVAIYQLKVAPTFLDLYDNYDIEIPAYLMFYHQYWGYVLLVVSIFIVLGLYTGVQIKKLFQFRLGIENSSILKYLVLPQIRVSYLKVTDVLGFPIHSSQKNLNRKSSLVADHLHLVEKSSMSLSTEMKELVEIEMRTLLESCEMQMKYISVLVALIVVSAIFFFLASAYAPIFILGEIV
jgi:hypothetical protein